MKASILKKFHLEGELAGAGSGAWRQGRGKILESFSPIDGASLGTIRCADQEDYEQVVTRAVLAFEQWPGPPG